jgi:hypothetical protein
VEALAHWWLLRHGTINTQFNFIVIGFGFFCLLDHNKVPCCVVLKTAKLLEHLERQAIVGSLIGI